MVFRRIQGERRQEEPQYFLPNTDNRRRLSRTLTREIWHRMHTRDTLILLCIGTDKITGDCLGPLIGTRLLERGFPHPVYGTLEHPVHALNLFSVLDSVRQRYAHPFFLAIDAAVGPAEKIGCISLSRTSICPGKGVRRPLPPVGNLSLTGIVSEASEDCASMLPYTRLFVVDRLAEFICGALMEVGETG